ncbi:MAG: FAD-binding oxidoreductase, partial [Pelagibacteraceae bacterium]|nr:FAD-binding oxidoreductase [Pelagibacteraceae bacterium]MBO6471541.1 FAD-binding oxidoreductase [Pelagibacteraceae bacterium]
SKIDSIIRKGDFLFLKYKKQEYQFDKIVVAAGAWSNFLAKTIGDNFPLDTERGYHIIFENNNNLLTRPVGWAKTGFYMTPMEDGIRAAGTVEIAGLIKPMNKNILAMIETTARSILPKLGKVKSQWMGFRPTLPDSLPVIGESRKCKNVYYAFGHQHLGLSLAAVTGKVMRSLIENQPTNINIDSLSPYRF